MIVAASSIARPSAALRALWYFPSRSWGTASCNVAVSGRPIEGWIKGKKGNQPAMDRMMDPKRARDGFWDVDCFQVKAFPGRQGFRVRERSTPPRDEIAAVVTRSRPAVSARLCPNWR
jgi:hypothetical protein